MKSRRHFVSRETQRRKLVWSTLTANPTVANGAHDNLDILADFRAAGASLLGVTIMRTHVRLDVVAPTAADLFVWGLSVGGLNDIGTAAGAIDAGADTHLDWMMWTREIAAPTYSEAGNSNRLLYDIKAKRKMQELDQRYLLSIGGVIVGTSPLNVFVTIRTLLALP